MYHCIQHLRDVFISKCIRQNFPVIFFQFLNMTSRPLKRSRFDILPDDSPPAKKIKSGSPEPSADDSDGNVVWFNYVPEEITSIALQQHLWSQFQINTQPEMKVLNESETFFSIEITPEQVQNLLTKSPMEIKGHSIELSTECLGKEKTVETKSDDLLFDLQLLSNSSDVLANDEEDDDGLSICDDDEEEEGEIRESDSDHETLEDESEQGQDETIEKSIHPVGSLLDIDPPSEMSISPNNPTSEIIVCGQSTDDQSVGRQSGFSGNESSLSKMNGSANLVSDGTIGTIRSVQNTDNYEVTSDDDGTFKLSHSQRDTLQNYKDNVLGYDMQIEELKRNLRAEERRYHQLLQQIGGDGNDGDDEDQKRTLIQLREREIRLNNALSQREKDLIAYRSKLDRSEASLSETQSMLDIHKKNEVQSRISDKEEHHEWDRDRKDFERRLTLMIGTNKKLKKSVSEMELNEKRMYRQIKEMKEDNQRAEARWERYHKALDLLNNDMVDRREKSDRSKAELQRQIDAVRAKLDDERQKHGKSKSLLKQTVNGIKTNLTAINEKNREKDRAIQTIQEEIQSMQASYPWLSKIAIS